VSARGEKAAIFLAGLVLGAALVELAQNLNVLREWR
jgi:hypothetical protein